MNEMSGQSQHSTTQPEPHANTVTELLAHRLARPVDQHSRARAVLHLLDWVGCAIAGTVSDAAIAMKKTTGTADDIFYLGCLGNVLEMDDVDKRALLHPGPVIIPAALVAAQTVGADAPSLLDGIVRGYEAVIRVGRAVGPGHYKYWHNTGTCGPFGAAAAAASLYQLDIQDTVSALGLAGTQASGLWQTRHEPASHAKQLHTSRAAHAGLMAAQLARSGFVGPKTILEGEQGFFAATCAGADPYAVVDVKDDAPFAIHDVSFKPWPACRHAHAAIDAALAHHDKGVTPEKIQKITIRTYHDALVFCDKPHPSDTLSAKFSLQHSVAVCLLNGKPALDFFDGGFLEDEVIRDLRARIDVVDDAQFSENYPARFGSAVDIIMQDGTEHSVCVEDALGDPENPVSEAVIVQKADSLMAVGGLHPSNRQSLIDAILSLKNQDSDFDEVTAQLRCYIGGSDGQGAAL